ncbi:MAG: hypothetical protein L3J79_07530, partial [Candidatus Marinimicrobia bacterium]|nr:hypothetical protein [Candidatus Neomarinimicrobiota bacterium]
FDDGSYESCNGITYSPTSVTSEDCLTCHPSGNEDDCDGRNLFKFRPFSFPTENKQYETD